MAKTNIKGKQVALYLDKTPDADEPTLVRFLCADSVSLTVNTEEVEVTADCEADEDENAVVVKDYEPGDVDISGSISGNIRRIDGADTATNFTAEELLDLQLAGTILRMRYSLGTAVGATRYDARIFFTQNQFTGADGAATFSANFRVKGRLTKSAVPAPVVPGP